MRNLLLLFILLIFSCSERKKKENLSLRVNNNVTLSFENNDLEFLFSDTLFDHFDRYRYVYFSKTDSLFVIITYENGEQNRVTERLVDRFLISEPKQLIEFSPDIIFHEKAIVSDGINQWCKIYFEMFNQHEIEYITVLNRNDILSISIRSLIKDKYWRMPFWARNLNKSIELSNKENKILNESIKKLRDRKRFW
jgi:hypothetical protein